MSIVGWYIRKYLIGNIVIPYVLYRSNFDVFGYLCPVINRGVNNWNINHWHNIGYRMTLRKDYSQVQMQAALNAVVRGMADSTTAETYSVPRITKKCYSFRPYFCLLFESHHH